MTSPSSLDLDALEALEKKATPGDVRSGQVMFTQRQWGFLLTGSGIMSTVRRGGDVLAVCWHGEGKNDESEAEYQAALRNNAKELLRLARIGQKYERMENALEKLK